MVVRLEGVKNNEVIVSGLAVRTRNITWIISAVAARAMVLKSMLAVEIGKASIERPEETDAAAAKALALESFAKEILKEVRILAAAAASIARKKIQKGGMSEVNVTTFAQRVGAAAKQVTDVIGFTAGVTAEKKALFAIRAGEMGDMEGAAALLAEGLEAKVMGEKALEASDAEEAAAAMTARIGN